MITVTPHEDTPEGFHVVDVEITSDKDNPSAAELRVCQVPKSVDDLERAHILLQIKSRDLYGGHIKILVLP